MKAAGVIAEYNPFHRGHQYQLAQIRKVTGAEYTVIAMSGDFVQRGGPAIADKYVRTQMALAEGADLVLELPARYATASAGNFARGGVALLSATGIVNFLCFGGETAELSPLLHVSRLLQSLDPDSSDNVPDSDLSAQFHRLLNQALAQGRSYPRARADALTKLVPSVSPELLKQPNNILAIEYLGALRGHPEIQPVLIPRRGGNYSDPLPAREGDFSSATAIRRLIVDRVPSDVLAKHLPVSAAGLLASWLDAWGPVTEDDFSSALGLRLLELKAAAEEGLLTPGDSLTNRMLGVLPQYQGFSSFVHILKTKSMTESRIRRALTRLLLCPALPPEDLEPSPVRIPYLRVLGFRKSSAPLLTAIKKEGEAPLLTKMADSARLISSLPDPNSAGSLLREDLFAAELYRQQLALRAKTIVPNEFNRGLVIL